MFKDQQFVETPKVDARGQPLRRDAGKQKLQEFYELAGVEGAEAMASSAQDEDVAENEAEDELDLEGLEEEDLDESEEEEEQLMEDTVEDIPQGDASRRFAVMGCDWDHVSAGDLLVMFRTYLATARSKSQAGSVDKISIFPSDYGLQQLEREAKEGPLLDSARIGLDENEEAQQEALRKYQMNRTKYYWALVECDSVSTASWLYDQMDGLEADGVCPASLDLRFVPDDLEPPHEASSVATELPNKFAGPQQLRSAAGHTKVKCTWDEPPAQRRKDLMKKRFTPQELAEMDLQAYLDSESDDEKQGAEDLKALVAGSDSEGFLTKVMAVKVRSRSAAPRRMKVIWRRPLALRLACLKTSSQPEQSRKVRECIPCSSSHRVLGRNIWTKGNRRRKKENKKPKKIGKSSKNKRVTMLRALVLKTSKIVLKSWTC